MDNKLQAPQEEALPSEIQPNRNKVALKPGHSLMDWIRFSNSGKDMTGTNGRLLRVTPQMLSQHCTPGDAWIALRGNVYNVSHYMDFHPGGQAELMRGVGKDGTDLFNEIHRWVNFENLLKKCLVGKLVGPSASDLRKMSLGGTNSPNLLKPPDPPLMNKGISTDEIIRPPSSPTYNWEQTSTEVTVTIATAASISEDQVILDLKDQQQLQTYLRLGSSHFYLLHLELQEQVQRSIQVRCQGPRLHLTFTKEEPGQHWAELGSPLTGHSTLLTAKEKGHNFRPCRLRSKEPVTHDTFLFVLELPECTRLPVAVGQHVRLKLAAAKGSKVVRSYTPVSPGLRPGDCLPNNLLHFLIKIYPTGTLTAALDLLPLGEVVEVSDPTGSFEVSRLSNHRYTVLLAAGTGFTPMVRVLLWLSRNPLPEGRESRLVKLLFFNKTQKDIMWREQLETLAACDNGNEVTMRLEVVHVLSEPEEGWTGPRGRVRRVLLESQLPPVGEEPFVCVCGPDPFTHTSLEILSELGFSPQHTHAFTA